MMRNYLDDYLRLFGKMDFADIIKFSNELILK